MRIRVKNIRCPVCHHRTYFTGKVVYESERTQVIEWKCADCGIKIRTKHDKLGREYDQRRKEKGLSPSPALWIRKGSYRELLYIQIGRRLYAFRYADVERLERDEILAIPVYIVPDT